VIRVPVSLSALRTRAIVLDIEGTTTPVGFVYQVLFPFARTHAAAYLQRQETSDACRAAIDRLRAEQATDRTQGHHPPDPIPDYVDWLMDRDRKSPGLKALQGLIWQEGYESGELRGEVYRDVPPALERWRAHGIDVAIYSSGSVLAQQLLFGSTEEGDLTRLLTGYFDTAVGPKDAADSYHTIAARMRAASAAEMLFVSDVAAELDGAAAAGWQTALCVRGGRDAPPGSVPHVVIRSFEEIA
jgi:enolase-phosphatase E1